MAKVTTKKGKGPTSITSGTAVEEPPEIQNTPFEPEVVVSPPVDAPPPRAMTFFQRMDAIDKEDWGPRANVYLYRTEPVIDRLRGGEKKYIQCYGEPISEERILVDHGSGRYKAVLNFKKPSEQRGDEIDSYFFDILNLKFPPKVPKGDWTEDPKNRRWAWAREPEPLPPGPALPSGLSEATSAFKTFVEIQKEMRAQTKEDHPPAAPPAAAPPAAPDPFDTAAKIMQMRANDPMIAALMQRLDASDKAAEAARLREFELQKELRQPASNGNQKGWLDQLVELATAAEKLDPVKKLLGGLFGGITNGAGSAASEGVIRTARTTGLDVLRDFVTSPVAEKIGAGLGDLFSSMANAPPPPVTIPLTPTVVAENPAPRPQAAPRETDQQRIIRIAQTITGPMLDEFFDQDEPGDLFAEKVFDFWPADLKFLQGLGAERILNLYRGFAPAWARIGPKEQQFAQFLKEFCEWQPEADDEPGVPEDDGIVDLDSEKGEGATA
jgi:hypothetical protein